jgi:hypothetical protein
MTIFHILTLIYFFAIDIFLKIYKIVFWKVIYKFIGHIQKKANTIHGLKNYMAMK